MPHLTNLLASVAHERIFTQRLPIAGHMHSRGPCTCVLAQGEHSAHNPAHAGGLTQGEKLRQSIRGELNCLDSVEGGNNTVDDWEAAVCKYWRMKTPVENSPH